MLKQHNDAMVVASSIAFSSIDSMRPVFEQGIGVEVFMDMPNWYDEVVVENSLNRLVQTFGLIPLSFHASMGDELDLSEPLGSVPQQKALATFHRTLAMAGRLSALHMVIHTHEHHKLIPDDVRPVYQERVKHSLTQLGIWADQWGVEVLVENIGTAATGTLLFREQEFIDLFDEIQGINALVDVGHAFLNRWDIPDVLRRLGPRVSALHLHDNHGLNDEHLPIGKGRLPWDAIGEAVRNLATTPTLVLEYETVKDGKIMEELLDGEAFVRSWLEQKTKLEHAG